jgi:hypothetical protein
MSLSDSSASPAYPSRASGWVLHPPAEVSRVASVLLCRHALATTTAGSVPGSGCSPLATTAAFPKMSLGRLPHLSFSRPARRSLALGPVGSRNRLTILSIEGFDSFVTSAAAPIATGWSNSCQVGIAPTEERRLCTAHDKIGHKPGALAERLQVTKTPYRTSPESSALVPTLRVGMKSQTLQRLRLVVKRQWCCLPGRWSVPERVPTRSVGTRAKRGYVFC